MQEVITYSMTTMEALKQVVPPEDLATYPPLRVVNPQSSDFEYLRPVLRANLLRTLATNVRQHPGEVALFEAARVYLTEPSGRPTEQEHIVGVVGGQREDRWGRGSGEPVDFYDAKGYIESALGAIDVAVSFNEAALFSMLPGRAAELTIDGRVVGSIGQVHPKVAAAFDIDTDAYLFELVLDELLPFVGGVHRAEPIVRFPAVVEDLALVVAKTVPAERVRALIEQHALVRGAQVFDVYEGERIGPDKKSLAFSVTYQSQDHTLDDKEVAKARSAIVSRLENELNAELRG
jgi:phenylalanyl-tRNA synthetase beta chain